MSLDVTAVALSAGLGYLIGSLAFGYWIAKAKGIDIFSVGSRSPGATNVKRSVGKAAGNAVFVLDFVKGLVATGWPALAYSNYGSVDAYALVGLFAAVIGHSYSLFTGFRGGKGVASMLGGVVALMPLAALIGIGVWLVVFYSTRYVSVASIIMAMSLPVSNYFMRSSDAMLWVSIALAVVVVARHKSNITRLMRGEENRFEKTDSDSEEVS
ncbi:MAG: acyl-phosphate glycerol 3-phosphate acyltransferase [Opitutales bacterium TMED158]|nr:MAG: acyl-phosphate glycerol 3-phosphate acyltransferase [Opitutales bacterium TMED158]